LVLLENMEDRNPQLNWTVAHALRVFSSLFYPYAPSLWERCKQFELRKESVSICGRPYFTTSLSCLCYASNKTDNRFKLTIYKLY
jgi:hypothetical protein